MCPEVGLFVQSFSIKCFFAIRSAKSKMAQIKEVIRKKLEVGCVQID